MRTVAIIGGTGVYEAAGLDVVVEHHIGTPFGPTSDPIIETHVDGAKLFFLSRHGAGHRHLPTEVPFQANIFALKSLGVDAVIGVSAIGSLRQEMAPGDIVIADQYIDRTRHRPSTFFGEGIVGHVSLADPTCASLSQQIATAVPDEVKLHIGGTYVCMEGPAFSTRAESHMYRSWGADIIGMTNIQEAKLCREAEMCYVPICFVTDYDCWHESEEAVTVEAILQVLQSNSARAQQLIKNIAAMLSSLPSCDVCTRALDFAVVTAPDQLDMDRVAVMEPIFGRLNLGGSKDV